jgi:hypothetical protein
MSAGKIIGYIFAAITIFFGVLYIWSAFDPVNDFLVNLFIGIISASIGFAIIWFLGRKKPGQEEIQYNIDLSGDVNLDTLSCESCGGQLSSDNISMVAGAPVVSCPFCGTSYQLTEEPKW